MFKFFNKNSVSDSDSVSAYLNSSKTRITVVVCRDKDSVIYILPISVYHHVSVTRSYSSLVSFAKAHNGTSINHIHDLYIANSVNRLSKKPLCPRLSETSSLSEVDGGILFAAAPAPLECIQ